MIPRFILLTLIILPFFVSAQSSNQQMHQQINTQRQRWSDDWHMQQMNPHSSNKIQTAEKKLAREEENKKKLEEKAEKLKANQDELEKLKNNATTNNNIDLQKSIEKSQEKLNQNNKELELSSKKIDDLKKQVEALKSEEDEKMKKEGKTIYTLSK